MTNHRSLNGTSDENAEFVDLISVLRAKDVFGEDSAMKYMRRKKTRNSPHTREHSRDRILNITLQK